MSKRARQRMNAGIVRGSRRHPAPAGKADFQLNGMRPVVLIRKLERCRPGQRAAILAFLEKEGSQTAKDLAAELRRRWAS